MVMSTVDVPVTTIEDLFALPEDGVRHELLRGTHVVTPAPRYTHQDVVGEFFHRFRSHLGSTSSLKALFSATAGPNARSTREQESQSIG